MGARILFIYLPTIFFNCVSSSASPFPCTPHPFRSTKIDNPIRRNQKSSSNPGRRRRDYELLLLLVCVGSHKREIAQCIHVSFICRANRLNLLQSRRLNGMICFPQPEISCSLPTWWLVVVVLSTGDIRFMNLRTPRRWYFIKWWQIFRIANSGAFNKKLLLQKTTTDRRAGGRTEASGEGRSL